MSYPWAAHLFSALTAPLYSHEKYCQAPPYPVIPAPTSSDRILVIAPHPDDETTLAGGYIAAAVQAGSDVRILIVSDGNAQGHQAERFTELSRALQELGVSTHQTLGLPDGQLNANTILLREKIGSAIAKLQPTVIVFPHPRDRHTDHAVVGRAVLNMTETDGLKRYAYPDHFPPHLPHPRGYFPDLYIWAPQALADDSWVSFPLSPTTLAQKERAVHHFVHELQTPVLRSHMLSSVRRNELFAQF